MGRAFDFNQLSKTQARLRQFGRCACKGERLKDLEEHAHHVYPNQAGQPGNPQHVWLASTINCVILCAVCHERVHENGHYRAGAVAPPSYYPYSHGGDPGLHGDWVTEITSLSHTLGFGWQQK